MLLYKYVFLHKGRELYFYADREENAMTQFEGFLKELKAPIDRVKGVPKPIRREPW